LLTQNLGLTSVGQLLIKANNAQGGRLRALPKSLITSRFYLLA
jgi:hypothetical protein